MKNKKIMLLISVGAIAFIGIVALLIWGIFDGGMVKSKPDGIDITQLYKVNIYGTQGEGYVDLTLDEGYFEAYIIETGISLAKEDIAAEVSKPNNLSNGDKFTVKFKKADTLQNKGVKVIKSEGVYTVDRLKEGHVYDVFADVQVYVEEGKVIFDDSKCANFIKDNVDFFIKSQQNTYKNGDVITIGAYVDMNAATENGYKIEITHKKITITEQERTND